MFLPSCMSQATSHTPFDFRVDTSLETDRKCAKTSLSMRKKKHNLEQKTPGEGDDPFHKKEKMQVKKKVSKRKVLALYEDYLKKKVKETCPSRRMGTQLFEEIKAKGYQGSFSTMKKFVRMVRKEGDFPKETSLSYYKGYIKKRLEETQPDCVSAKKLFYEITAKGYRGSFSAVEKFLWVIRKDTKMPKEASIQCHKEYLIKRVKEAYPKYVSGTELLGEIKAKGYQGTLKTLQSFLTPIHKSIAPKPSLTPYKDYLIKRLKDALPDRVSGKELFEEIRAQGYRGSVNTVQTFLSALRKKEIPRPKEVSLDFHKGYLLKRLKDASPNYVSGTELFEEIRAKGYRGSVVTVQAFLSMLRKQENKPSENLSNASVEFHKEYLIKRLEETYPSYVSGKELFKEISAKGYQESLSTLQMFLSTLCIRKKRPIEACVEFYEEYLSKRVKETSPHCASATELFKEIQAKGYQGAFNTFRVFLSTLRKQEKKPSEAYVEFHRDYLTKRLKETCPNFASGSQLFKEIQAKGYQGSLGSLQGFLSRLRKQTERPSEACVRFHKDYLSKRIKDALPNFVPSQTLFEEITDRGYRGAFGTLRVFLSTLRKQEDSPSKGLKVHRNYSIKRLEKPQPIHTEQLFEETPEKRIFSASEPYKNDLPKQLDKAPLVLRNVLPEASLQFHKEYLIKTLQETWPSRLSPKQLFEEIISRGYRGTCKEVEVFLMMASK